MNNILTGAAMGAALTAAGVYAPDIILSQFTFTDYTMFQTFLTAAAGSTVLVTASQTLNLTNLPPRGPSTLGLGLSLSSSSSSLPSWWTRHEGNILGGALVGAGMALSGACPGTLLAQLGVGVKSGWHTMAGAVLAGVVWSWIGRRRRRRVRSQSVVVVKEGMRDKSKAGERKEENKESGEALTVYEALGFSRGVFVVLFEAVLVLALIAATQYTNASAARARGIPPYLAGLAIAAAQLVSIVLRGSLLGASTAFEELGGWVWGVREYSNVLFSVGLVGGAWLLSLTVPALRPVTDVAVSPLRSVLGGFMIVFGSRMAGGCTSGHGISGLSLMSISSFLTAAATFGMGGLTGLLIG
ncbi:hypothetical protein N657DRAFT_654149 [Parathielavia appendiculata]|uniref:Sulphur transport domain-containing protein n=1 Tax=Parathielavia appendiculata TaxID=2587402 RepID=A0AAN6U3V9_9PEZI|nr:hypothetical protein N657DRAFT_654149 [Parathielavia appendiculata]